MKAITASIVWCVLSLVAGADAGDKKALQKAKNAVRNKSSLVAGEAVKELAKHGAAGLPGLKRALDHKNRAVVFMALSHIARLGPEAKSVLPTLKRKLRRAAPIAAPTYAESVIRFGNVATHSGVQAAILALKANTFTFPNSKKEKRELSLAESPGGIDNVRLALLNCAAGVLDYDARAIVDWMSSLPNPEAETPDLCMDIECALLWPSYDDRSSKDRIRTDPITEGSIAEQRAWFAQMLYQAVVLQDPEQKKLVSSFVSLTAISVLKSEDPGLRWRALSGYEHLGMVPIDKPVLVVLSKDPLAATRMIAVSALQRDYGEPPADLADVIAIAEDTASLCASYEAIRVLSHLKDPSDAAIDALRGALVLNGPALELALDGVERFGSRATSCLPALRVLSRKSKDEELKGRIDAVIVELSNAREDGRSPR